MQSVDTLPTTTFSGRRFTRRQLARVQETVERFRKLSCKELARTVAHFVLITLNRLFANRADTEINAGQTSTPLDPQPAPNRAPSTAAGPGRKTNFNNCMHVLARSLEELLLLHERVKDVVQRAFRAIVARHQRIRPNRSYPRRSMRPETKWHPSKEKKRDQKAAVALAPA